MNKSIKVEMIRAIILMLVLLVVMGLQLFNPQRSEVTLINQVASGQAEIAILSRSLTDTGSAVAIVDYANGEHNRLNISIDTYQQLLPYVIGG